MTSDPGTYSTASFAPFGGILSRDMICTLLRCAGSAGNVLKRFFELRIEVKRFMDDGRMDVPEFAAGARFD